MADLRIVCTDQRPIYEPAEHAHIVSVGVDLDGNGRAEEQHKLSEVVGNIRTSRHRYFTRGLDTGLTALVEVVDCPAHCGEKIIRSAPDAVRDNNLDNLRLCSWA